MLIIMLYFMRNMQRVSPCFSDKKPKTISFSWFLPPLILTQIDAVVELSIQHVRGKGIEVRVKGKKMRHHINDTMMMLPPRKASVAFLQ